MNRTPLFQPEDRAAPGDDDDPTLTDDMLELYFSSTRTTGRPGPSDIWRSTRRVVTDPWGKPALAAGLNEANPSTDDQNPGITGDGLTLWFSSNRGGGGMDIYVTSRGARDQAWDPPRRVVELSTASPFDDLGPEPAASKLRIALYGDSPRRLFEAARASVNAPWEPHAPIDSLNTPSSSNHLSGFFVTDLELWFASDRPNGFGMLDIYRAVRPAIDQPFGPPALVEGVNGVGRDDDPWLSPDRHILFFTSTSETGNQELFVADRP